MPEMSENPARASVLALTSIASFMVSLDSQVVATALSTIRMDLDASIEQLEWTVNAYILTFAVLLMTGAALGDRLGRRRMFVVGLALFVAASAACASAPSIGWLIAARVVQGAGGALVMPLAMALLSAAFPREERGKALGIFTGITGLALIAGPAAGGAIAEGIAWQWIFWLNLPIGLVLIPLALNRIPESFGSDTSVDVPGLVLVTFAALGLVWGLMRGNSAGWVSPEVIATIAVGIISALAFVAYELRAPAPMLPMRFFRSRAFSSGSAAGFFIFACVYGALFFIAQFLQTAHGHGPLAAGLRLLPWTATLFVVAPVAGALINRVGERSLIVGGLLLQAIGMGWVALIAAPDVAYTNLIAPLILAGAGVSMAMPASQNAVLSAVAPTEIGKASGAFNTLRFLGGVFGIAILVAVFSGTGSIASPQAFSAGFVSALGFCAVLSLLGAIAGLWLPQRRERVLAPGKASAAASLAALILASSVLVAVLTLRSSDAAEGGEPFSAPLPEIPAEQQVQLAMGAAPPEISRHATILVLGPNGYVTAQNGTNGYTCLVERQFPETLEPSCYDAEGSATTLLARIYREELRVAKIPEEDIERRIDERYKAGAFKAPRKAGFVYMLSPHNKVYNDRTKTVIRVPPHLMFYAPYMTQKDIGEFVGPHIPYVVLEGRPDAYIIVAPALMARALQQPAKGLESETGRHSHGK